MTFEVLQNEVVRNLGNRNDSDTLAIILARTNFFVEWLASQKEWEDLQREIQTTLTRGQAEYPLGVLGLADLDKIYSISLNDGSKWQPPMVQVTRLEWVRTYQTIVVTGRPTVYCRYAGKLSFSKTPDAAYTIQVDYYAQPTKIVNTASVIPFKNLDGLFEAAVTALCWLSLGEKELYDKWFKMASGMIDSFGLDSCRLLNQATPNRQAMAGTNYWQDPFKRR